MGEFDRALEVYKQAQAVVREELPPNDAFQLAMSHYVALAQAKLGQTDAALATRQDIKSRIDPKDADTEVLYFISLTDLGTLMAANQRYLEAEECFQTSLDRLQSLLPASHPALLNIRTNLALNWKNRGQLDKAAEALQSILTETEHYYPQSSARVGQARINLAAVLHQRGSVVDARQTLERAVRQTGDTAVRLQASKELLVLDGVQSETDRAALARLFEEACKSLGNNHPTTIEIEGLFNHK